MRYIAGGNSNYLGKCIGGGTGANTGHCVIENCQFYNDNTVSGSQTPEVSYHGAFKSDEACHFKLTVSGCYFEHKLGLDQLGANQTAECVLHGNSMAALPTANAWDLLQWNNETRQA